MREAVREGILLVGPRLFLRAGMLEHLLRREQGWVLGSRMQLSDRCAPALE